MKVSQEYTTYLRSSHWKRLRAAAFARFGKRCQGCGSPKQVQGHHLIYRTPLKAGQVEDVMPLCRCCHEIVHATPAIDRGFRLLPHVVLRREFIRRILTRRIEPVPPKAEKARFVRPVRHPKPQPIPKPHVPDLELEDRIRTALIARSSPVLGIPVASLQAMTNKQIRRLGKIHRKAVRKAAADKHAGVLAQYRAQVAANPNATHFVFTAVSPESPTRRRPSSSAWWQGKI